jgi:class 3 adenylate cyclase
MSRVVSYEIEIQANGQWRKLQSFEPNALGEAKSIIETLQKNPRGSGVKLVEKTLEEDGLFKRRTLAFKRFDDAGAAPKSALAEGRPATGTRAKDVRKPANAESKAAKAQPEKKPASGKRFDLSGSLTDLLSFLFVPIRAHQVDGEHGDATVTKPEIALPTQMRGQVAIYDDEAAMPQDDVVVVDTTYRQFLEFFEALSQEGLLREARQDPEFSRKISMFAIGILFSIENDIDIFSDRGKAMVARVLGFFIDSHDAVGNFVQTMERYLTARDAPEALRLGSKCFKLYQAADTAALREEFQAAFGIADKLVPGLGGMVKVGILFTDIVDSTKMTSEIGDLAAQQVIDHHDTVVMEVCRRFGGRRVKHLGDGLMLSFANKEKMVACAVAVVDAMKGLANRPDAPTYEVRCGGHFGEAIMKEQDFFGSTVQLAARISSKAGSNEACFSSVLFDRDLPTYERFQNKGAAELKGINQPVALAVYG